MATFFVNWYFFDIFTNETFSTIQLFSFSYISCLYCIFSADNRPSTIRNYHNDAHFVHINLLHNRWQCYYWSWHYCEGRCLCQNVQPHYCQFCYQRWYRHGLVY